MVYQQSTLTVLKQVTLNITPEDSAKTKLSCIITIAGEDVIGGVQDMVEAGTISSPPPDWVMVPLLG